MFVEYFFFLIKLYVLFVMRFIFIFQIYLAVDNSEENYYGLSYHNIVVK
jgi:hypothetical protein